MTERLTAEDESLPRVSTETGQTIETLSAEEIKALSDYQVSCGNINVYLRTRSKNEVDHIPSGVRKRFDIQVEAMDAIFDRIEGIGRPLTVYRCPPRETQPSPDEFTSPCYVGTRLDPTLTLDELTRRTNRKMVQVFVLKQGQKALYVPDYRPNDAFLERELLLPRCTKFRVIKREEMNGKLVETIEVVE